MSNELKIVKLVKTTNGIKGVSFASLRGYYSSTTKETADYKINLNVTLKNQKAKDLKILKQIHLAEYFNNTVLPLNNPKFTLELLQEAFVTVYNSLVEIGQKNFDGTIKTQSRQSKAQIDAYQYINGSLKFHPGNESIKLFGMVESKTVTIPGEYKTTNSRPKTILQNMLKKVI